MSLTFSVCFYPMIYVTSLPEEVVCNSIALSSSLLIMDSFAVSSLKTVHHLQRQNYLHIDSEIIDSSIYMLKRISLTQVGTENNFFFPSPFLSNNSDMKQLPFSHII